MVEFQRTDRRSRTLQGMLAVACLAITLQVWPAGRVVRAAEPRDPVLDLSIEELMDVPITAASKATERAEDAPAIVTVIGRDQIRAYGARNLGEVLNRVTSALFLSANVLTDNLLSMRRQTLTPYNTHVLVLLNGRPLRDPIAGGINHTIYAVFPIEVLDHVEVIRGPGSVLHGSNAYSGVINLITLGADGESLDAGASVTAGNHGASAQSGHVHVRDGDLALTLALSRWNEGGPDYSFTGYRDSTATTNWFRETTGLFVDMQHRGLRAQFYYADFRPESLWMSENAWMPERAWGNGRSVAVFGDVGYQHALTEDLHGNLNLTYNDHEWFSWQPDGGKVVDVEDVLAEMTLDYDVAPTTRLLVGGTVQYTDHYSDLLLGGDETAGSFYVQGDHWPHERLKLVAGAQYNRVEGIDGRVSPRAAVITHLHDRLTLKFLYSQAFRSGSQLEKSFDHPVFRGSPELRPELVDTYEAQVAFRGETFTAAVTGYHSTMSDIVVRRWVEHDGESFVQNVNGGEHEFVGLEFEGRMKLGRGLMLEGNASFAQDEDDQGRENAALHPQTMLKGGFVHRGAGHSFGVWNSSFLDPTQVNDITDVAVPEVNPRPGDFHLLSARLRLDLGRLGVGAPGNYHLSVSGENLLGDEITYPEFTTRGINALVPLYDGAIWYAAFEATLR